MTILNRRALEEYDAEIEWDRMTLPNARLRSFTLFVPGREAMTGRRNLFGRKSRSDCEGTTTYTFYIDGVEYTAETFAAMMRQLKVPQRA